MIYSEIIRRLGIGGGSGRQGQSFAVQTIHHILQHSLSHRILPENTGSQYFSAKTGQSPWHDWLRREITFYR